MLTLRVVLRQEFLSDSPWRRHHLPKRFTPRRNKINFFYCYHKEILFYSRQYQPDNRAESLSNLGVIMAEQMSFIADKIFHDRINFPYGFARSGDFSNRQVALLEKHGQAYKALQDGAVEPKNAEEQAFVNCCQNQKPAETDHEKVWQKYRQAVVQRSSHFSPGSGSVSRAMGAGVSESDSDSSDADMDFD